MNYAVLYNPFADNGNGQLNAQKLIELLPNDSLNFIDLSKIDDVWQYFAQIPASESVILCGGDGTLNRFVNQLNGAVPKQNILYFACGSGNDFAREIASKTPLIPLNAYLKNLPTITIDGKEQRFINGIGYGIDGYCCEEGDRLRKKKPKSKINYVAIAIKGLLFYYKATNAVVTVDGKRHYFKRVWLAPTMFGKYYGGGMMPTPNQKRNNLRGKSSLMLFYGAGRIATLCMFPAIFKGEHTKYKKHVKVLSGSQITVEFDKPRPLQIDGETVLGVRKYSVKSAELSINKNRRVA